MDNSRIKIQGWRNFRVQKFRRDALKMFSDKIVAEEPLEMILEFGPEKDRTTFALNLTMRTPGQDEDLILGFLKTSGIIEDISDIKKINYSSTKKPNPNSRQIELSPEVQFDPSKHQRNFCATASCGLCGIDSLENLYDGIFPVLMGMKNQILPDNILKLSGKVKELQNLFNDTGGIHAAGIADVEGNPILVKEDIGRHNAVDKVIGAAMNMEDFNFKNKILFVSGRVSYELTLKCLMVGIPVLVAVGAPSSLAIEMAEENGLTLIGFLGRDRMNIYSNSNRLKLSI